MVSQRFSYVRYDATRTDKQAAFKGYFEIIEAAVMARLPEGRPQSLCLTALEEAYMWVGKAIRDEQIQVDGQVTEAKDRGEEGVNVAPKEAEGIFNADDVQGLMAGYALHVCRKSPGTTDEHGLETIAMSIVPAGTAKPLRTFHVLCGARGRQVFENGSANNVPGTLRPAPQGTYAIGAEQWAGGKDNYNATIGAGLGPCFIPFEPQFATKRGAFGIHLDSNHATSPGSAGCIVFETLAAFKDFLLAFRQYKPATMRIDWGF